MKAVCVLLTEQPRMGNSKLSFFDNFCIVSGIPTFKLDPGGERKEDHLEEECTESSKPDNAKVKKEITCCCFSMDGSKLASGHSDGSLTIWSTDNGTEVAYCENSKLTTQIADIRFLGGTNQVSLRYRRLILVLQGRCYQSRLVFTNEVCILTLL